MSAGTVAARQAIPRRPALPREAPYGRPLIRFVAFVALALYGALRWGTLLQPAPTGRLVAMVAIAVALGAAGPILARFSLTAAVLASILTALALLAAAGVPIGWISHVRVAVTARAISDGLNALPTILTPYQGLNHSVRMILLLGAAILLLDAALMLAFAIRPAGAGGPSGDLRRAVAALPLIALVAVPLTMIPAGLPYLQGVLLFGFLAAFLWGERLPRGRGASAALACAIAAAGAMVIAPSIRSTSAWLDYRNFAGSVGLGAAERFDWTQTYGPLNWPRDGHEVFSVTASHGDYWKAVDLDVFSGTGWSVASTQLPDPPDHFSAAVTARYTQTLSVTIAGMQTTNVIGAGDMTEPTRSTQLVTPGVSAGTWVTATAMGSGDSYRVRVYSPHPRNAELAAAGTRYPTGLWPYLALAVPSAQNRMLMRTVYIPPFGSALAPLVTSTGSDGGAVLAGSAYSQAWNLGRQLRAASATPFAYVQHVLSYLHHGFSYDENPPTRAYPLESFLFQDKRGYCQQFAGAMALLLRLGGIPARVAAGFTTGSYDAKSHQWLVSDIDAHAWVEAYFPRFGWVRFDPTPGADPALRNTPISASAPISSGALALPGHQVPPRQTTTAASTAQTVPRAHRSGGAGGWLWPAVAAVLAVLVLGLVLLRPVAEPEPDTLLAELERAFARAGRPLEPRLTLNELARRLPNHPHARAYVDALAAARFSGGTAAMTGRQRRALRAHLRSGRGAIGAMRALWALPPRRPSLRT